MELAGRGARVASLAGATGAELASRAMRGAKRGYRRGMDMAEDLSIDGIGEHLQEYFEAAKGAIEDTVSGELQDLRKSIRRRRSRLGI
jgi:hypothetical protein